MGKNDLSGPRDLAGACFAANSLSPAQRERMLCEPEVQIGEFQPNPSINDMSMTTAAVMATYNYAHGITGAVDSILKQTVRPDQIIIVDDGSTDHTRDVIASYGDAVIYTYQQNQGPGAARNAAVRVATCDWIAFLDHDDEWLPHKLEKQLMAVQETRADLCYTGFAVVCDGRVERAVDPPEPKDLFPGIRFGNTVGPSSTYMVRRSAFLSLGGFNEGLGASCEDWEFFFRLALASPVVKVKDRLMRYHYRPASASRQWKRMLEKELSIENTLLSGTSGLDRTLARRKFRAAVYYRAAIQSRAGGQSGTAHLLHSIWYWPSFGFLPKRFKTLGVELAEMARLRHRLAVSSRADKESNYTGPV